MIIDYNGKCATVLPVTFCINIYPGSKTGKARIDIGPWYVDRHSQLICDKPIILLLNQFKKYLSTCRPEDYSVIIEKYKKLKQEKENGKR